MELRVWGSGFRVDSTGKARHQGVSETRDAKFAGPLSMSDLLIGGVDFAV